MAYAAIMAGGAAFMHARENGRTADCKDTIVKVLFQRVFEIELDAGELHGREEFPVRKLAQAFGLAAHADKFLDIVIPGSDVGVANGPVDGDTLF